MDISFLIKGFITGLAIAAPVGPTTVLIIHRVINQSKKSALLSGLGAASADALFGLLAGFGVGLVAEFLNHHIFGIKLIGGLFLLYWGFRIFTSRFAEAHPLVKGEGKGGPFLSTYLLTLTNPMTITAFVAVLAGLGAVHIQNSLTNLGEWVIGICAGSFGWWLFVSLLIYSIRHKFDMRVITWSNRVMGIIIIAAAVLILIGLR